MAEPHDLVAIFHASFHPTKGNTIDWAHKSKDISLDALEFNALPSGLHLIEQDVIYFTKQAHAGVCIFRRRKSSTPGNRGFHLSSLGVLLEEGTRPRPWVHVRALKKLMDAMYDDSNEDTGKELARLFFEARRADGGDWAGWEGWSSELEGGDLSNPTLHLPHLLRILGPNTMTLYKHVLARRRILIYTLPPVEAACILCRVAGDLCFDVQEGKGKGKGKEPISVLGMVTLTDVERLKVTSGGWIACTTDAIFLEKPSYYDLLIDLTVSTPNRAARPAFYASKPQCMGGNRLSTVRFSWSDVKLWTELERILALSPCCPSDQNGAGSIVGSWTDVWRVYEDVCVLCAGLWMGAWRSGMGVRLEGDDDLAERELEQQGQYVRNVGMGIEGVPVPPSEQQGGKKQRRASALSWTSGTFGKSKSRLVSFSSCQPSTSQVGRGELSEEGVWVTTSNPPENGEKQVLTTLALLQTFHAHACFQVGVLEGLLVREGLLPPSPSSSSSSNSNSTSNSHSHSPSPSPLAHLRPRSRSPKPKPPTSGNKKTLTLSPKDILLFELGPLSALDARYLEWMVDVYGGGVGVVVKRGWRDWVGLVWVGGSS